MTSRKTSRAAMAAPSLRSLRKAVAQGPRPGRADAAGSSPATFAGDAAWSVIVPCYGRRGDHACPREGGDGPPLHRFAGSSLHPGLRDDPVVLRVELEVADALRQEVHMLGREEGHRWRLLHGRLVDLRPHLVG